MNLFELIIFGIIIYLIYTGIKTFKKSSQSGVLGKTKDGASEVVSEITKGADLIVNQIGGYSLNLKASAINSSVKKILKKNIKMTFGASSRLIGTYWATKMGQEILTGPFGKDRDLQSWNLRFYGIKHQGQSDYTKGRLDSFFLEISKDNTLKEYCKENNIQFLTITPLHDKASFNSNYVRRSYELFRVYKLTGGQWILIHNNEIKEGEQYNTAFSKY